MYWIHDLPSVRMPQWGSWGEDLIGRARLKWRKGIENHQKISLTKARTWRWSFCLCCDEPLWDPGGSLKGSRGLRELARDILAAVTVLQDQHHQEYLGIIENFRYHSLQIHLKNTLIFKRHHMVCMQIQFWELLTFPFCLHVGEGGYSYKAQIVLRTPTRPFLINITAKGQRTTLGYIDSMLSATESG